MSKLIKTFLVLALLPVLIFAACGEDESGLTDGTYIGEGQGYGGTVEVEVTIDGGELASIDVLEHSETEGIADTALETVPEEIIENNGTEDVDTVGGATETSEALNEAVEAALSKVE